MSDTFEFDDNDEILLNSIYTQASENIKSIKSLREPINTIDLSKKPKLDNSEDSLSPLLFQHSKTQAAHSSESGPSKTIKRIFPGPAGILADGNQTETCSQKTSSIFQDGPWEEMSKDFKVSGSTYLYDSFNIAWIKKEAIANQFANQKAPFLAAILLSLEVSDGQTQKSVNVTLRDRTGSIQGNILYSLYQDYASHFILGSVLILVQFGVLSCTCDKCENHHLTITPKNLSAIYNNKTKIVIKKMEPNEILSEFCERKKELALKARSHSLVKHNSTTGMSLNNKVRPQNIVVSRSLSSNNVEDNRSKDHFSIPKISSVSESLLRDKNTKSFNFKKEPLAQVTISENKNSNNPIKSSNHKNLTTTENLLTGDNNIDLANENYNKDSQKTKLEASIANETYNNSKSVQEPKRVFNLKKISPSEENRKEATNQIRNKRDESMQNKTSSTSIIKTAGNEVSFKADRSEHEELWKDVLNDVDINSFFDEDF